MHARARDHARPAVEVHAQVGGHVADACAHVARGGASPGAVSPLVREAVGHGQPEPVAMAGGLAAAAAVAAGDRELLAVKAGVGHAERAPEVPAQVVPVGQAALTLHEPPQQVVVGVGVRELAVGLPHPRVGEALVVAKAARLVEEVAHRHRARDAVGGQVVVHGRVQADGARVHQLLDGRRGHALGERADDEGLVRGGDVAHRPQVAHAVRVNHGHGRTRHARCGKHLVKIGVQCR